MMSNDPFQSEINSAIDLVSSGLYRDALDLSTKLLVSNPNNSLLLNIAGACNAGLGKHNRALVLYKKAIKIKPDYAKAHFNLAGTLHDLQQLEESVSSYKASISYEPDYAEAHNNLGNVYKELGDLEDAANSYESAIIINPDYVEALYSLSLTMEDLENPESINYLKKVLLIKPDFAEAHNNLGVAQKNQGLLIDATKSYKKALNLNSNYHEAYNNLGNVLKDLGKLDEAVNCYEKAISIQPDYPTTHNNLGNVLRDLGKLEEAIERYKIALTLNPDYAETYSNLGLTYSELDQFNNAADSYKKAIFLNPNDIDSLNNLGNVYKSLGELEKAVQSYEKAIKVYPEYAEAFNNLGNAYYWLHEYDKAVKSYKKAFSIEPDYFNAYFNLGICYQDHGHNDSAIKAYETALRINPNLKDAYNNLGNLFIARNQIDRASFCYESALKIDPGFTTVHRNLSTIITYEKGDKRIEHMNSLLSIKNSSQHDRINLYFALAKAYADIGENDKLFEVLNEGNQLRKKELNYSFKEDHNKHKIYKKIFESESVIQMSLMFKPLIKRPIFIVGMPRSGTTLLEQIICSHHMVYGGGESAALIKVINELLDDYSIHNKEFSEESCMLIRHKYSEFLNSNHFEENVITDKMPINFEHIGFILKAFPEAKIIHISRDAMATCWSIYKNYFSGVGMGFSYSMLDLAKYYNSYKDLMNFWNQLFPNKIYDVCYEDLTLNHEDETRKLLQYCDLDWDPNCLEFYNNQIDVQTTSALQVKQKIYQGSSEVWKKYEAYLQPLIDGLD